MKDKKRIKGISFKAIIITSFIAISLIPLAIISIYSYNSFNKYSSEQVEERLSQVAELAEGLAASIFEFGQEKVNSDLEVAEEIFLNNSTIFLDNSKIITTDIINQITKDITEKEIPTMNWNGKQIFQNFDEVDQIKSLVGGTATIFQVIDDGLLRISTNVMTLENKRAVGTFIPTSSPVYKTVMSGETFYGRAFVVNQWYLTAYEPFHDTFGNIIGVLYVGVPEKVYWEKLSQRFNKITIFDSGYIAIIDNSGTYLLSKDNERDGENIWDSQDSNGDFFIQNIVEKASTLNEGETFIYRYPWQNEGESNSQMRRSAISFYPEKQWIFIVNSVESEAFESANKTAFRLILLSFAFLGITAIMGIVIASRLVKPLNFTFSALEKISTGDFSNKTNINSSIKEIETLRKSIDDGLLPSLGKVFYQLDNLIEESNSISKELIESANHNSSISDDISVNLKSTQEEFSKLKLSFSEVEKSVQSINNTIKTQNRIQSEQSNAVSETSSSVEEMSANLDSVAKISDEKKQASSILVNITQEGDSKVSEIVELLLKVTQRLSQMSEIIEIINSIASSTNLLAMNAAIEAAHAGDAGKGFAVVSDEIRKLAESTSQNAGTISNNLLSLMDEINHVDSAGNDLKQLFSNISLEVDEFVNAFNEISTSTSELRNASRNIISNISDLRDKTLDLESSSSEINIQSEDISKNIEPITTVSRQVDSSIKNVIDKLKIVEASQKEVLIKSEKNKSSLDNLAQELDHFILE